MILTGRRGSLRRSTSIRLLSTLARVALAVNTRAGFGGRCDKRRRKHTRTGDDQHIGTGNEKVACKGLTTCGAVARTAVARIAFANATLLGCKHTRETPQSESLALRRTSYDKPVCMARLQVRASRGVPFDPQHEPPEQLAQVQFGPHLPVIVTSGEHSRERRKLVV